MGEDKTHEIGSKHDSPQNKSVRSKQQREAPQKGSWSSYHRDFQVKIQRCLPSIRKYYICLRKGNYLDIFRYSTVVQELVLSNPVLDILIDICTYKCTSTHSFKSRRLFPILPLATKPYLSRSFLQEKQFGATLEYRFEGHAHCFHMLSRTFSSRKVLMTPSMIPQLYEVKE